MNQKWIGRGALAFSLSLHGYLLYAAPRTTQHEDREMPPTFMELSALPPEPEELAPEPEQEVVPEPEIAEPEVAAPVVPAEAEPEAESEPEPAPPELTGTTLVAEGEGDFSAEVGSGSARTGAILAGTSQPAPARRAFVQKQGAAAPKKAPEPPAAVPLARLSKKPIPPDLGGALQKNYPAAARQQGRAGEAKVQARVEPSGSIGLAKVAFESEDGFGAACRKTLLASKWTAPLDRTGNPVATWVSYRCKFRID